MPPIGLHVQELDAIQKKLIELSHKLIPVYIPVFQPYLINGKHILVVFAPAGDNRPYKVPISLSEKRTERAMFIKRGSKTVKVKDGSDDERVSTRAITSCLNISQAPPLCLKTR